MNVKDPFSPWILRSGVSLTEVTGGSGRGIEKRFSNVSITFENYVRSLNAVAFLEPSLHGLIRQRFGETEVKIRDSAFVEASETKDFLITIWMLFVPTH